MNYSHSNPRIMNRPQPMGSWLGDAIANNFGGDNSGSVSGVIGDLISRGVNTFTRQTGSSAPAPIQPTFAPSHAPPGPAPAPKNMLPLYIGGGVAALLGLWLMFGRK